MGYINGAFVSFLKLESCNHHSISSHGKEQPTIIQKEINLPFKINKYIILYMTFPHLHKIAKKKKNVCSNILIFVNAA